MENHMSRFSKLLPALALSAFAAAGQAQVTVVNMTPNSLSGETHQDSEPNLAVNPANPLQIAGSAFTPDPLNTNAPIYVSTNGGTTWVLNAILPGNSAVSGTGDVTLRFGGTSNNLYIGDLRGGSGLRLNILRKANFAAAGLATVLVDRTGAGVDQPYTQATTVLGGNGVGKDRVYVGNNDFNAGAGRTATVDVSLDGLAATPPPPANFNARRIEVRATSGQDGPPIRPIYHPDGTVYTVFYGWRAFVGGVATTDLVVVRDDNWAAGLTQFTALTDPGDLLAGRRVVSGIRVPFNNFSQANFGQERFVGSNISIAVDPRTSSRVYVAWADFPGGNPPYTLHVRRSDNRGATWSAADLITVANATNPALAVNTQGKVGFLYQQVTGAAGAQRWETHLRRSTDLGVTWNDLVLARPPAGTPAVTFIPYIGDYVHLMAVGKDFYGIFSANNTPDLANFPQGVTYQRNANFTTHVLLNTNNVTPVSISIDPFFFHVVEVPAASDFYVRDWTDSPTSGDTGLEPSTHPVFYTTSDVWNRRGTLPGPFVNDQPSSEPAGNGLGIIGDNWAFARIRRNALPSSGSQTVSAHFLISKFGTGSNYVDASSADPDVTFFGPDPTVTFTAADLGPFITAAYHWHLNPVSSNHVCMAVQITGPNDPFVAPTLRGNAPGWPATDLRILLDNNKAQRNLGTSTTPARGIGHLATLHHGRATTLSTSSIVAYHGIVHNAATFPRDIVLQYSVAPEIQSRLSGGTLEVVGQGTVPLDTTGGTLVLPAMQPGENRWVSVNLPAPAGQDGEVLTVDFQEVADGQLLDGFSVGVALATGDRLYRDAVERDRSVFTRLAVGFGSASAKLEADDATALLGTDNIDDSTYASYLAAHVDTMSKALAELGSNLDGDPFGTSAELANLTQLVADKTPGDGSSVSHLSFLNRLDSLLTLRQLALGDTADILQNVRWQRDLYIRAADLAAVGSAGAIVDASRAFVSDWEDSKVDIADYPSFLQGLFSALEESARALASKLPGLSDAVKAIESATGLTALQKAHRDYLVQLQTLDVDTPSPSPTPEPTPSPTPTPGPIPPPSTTPSPSPSPAPSPIPNPG
jgi:hypothetical protein